jgi:hypothetical protein
VAEKESLGVIQAKKVNVTHDVTIGGNCTISGSLNAAGNAVTQGTITTLTVSGNGTVAGTLGVSGNATVGGTLGVTGTLSTVAAATIGGNLSVTGTSALTGAVTTTAGVTVGGVLAVTGASNLTGLVTTTAGLTVGTALIVGNTGVFTGAVSAPNLARCVKVALAAVDTAGGVFSWQNPEGAAIIVKRVIVSVTTVAAGACTLNVGTTAVSGTTSANNLLTTLDIHSATGIWDNLLTPGASGKACATLASGKWVTGSLGAGATSGLVGSAYIEYILA